MRFKTTQIVLVLSALILFVLLFIAPKIAPQETMADKQDDLGKSQVDNAANLQLYLDLALKSLDVTKKKEYEHFLSSKNVDSIVVFWDKLKRPDLASFYSEEIAKKTSTANSWLKAGNRYYYAIQFTQDKTAIPILYQSASRCFAKSLVFDKTNIDAKIMLASCYVEGSENPMEGIKQLREIEKQDSNNVKLQLTFAFFSVRSGQLDKAISRFKKVIAIDSNYIEAYLHLADAYEQQNNTKKTIEVLEKYSSKTNDITARLEINKYIEQLKNKN